MSLSQAQQVLVIIGHVTKAGNGAKIAKWYFGTLFSVYDEGKNWQSHTVFLTSSNIYFNHLPFRIKNDCHVTTFKVLDFVPYF